MSARRQLGELPRTPESHFRLHVYAAVLDLRGRLPVPDAQNGLGFLAGYNAELDHAGFGAGDAEAVAGWSELLATWEAEAADHLPLRALRAACGLDALALRLLFTAGLVEEDLRFGQIFQALNGLPDEPRPTLGLLATWTADGAARDALHALLQTGLLTAADSQAPRARRGLHVPPWLWDAMRGRAVTTPVPWAHHRSAAELTAADELILPQETARALARLPALVCGAEARPVIVRGPRGSGRRAVIGALARSLGRGLLEVADPAVIDQAGPLATLLDAVPIVELDPAPGERAELPSLSSYAGPVGIVMPARGGIRAGERALTVTLDIPDLAARTVHWTQALPSGAADPAALAARFRLPAATIRTTAQRACSEAALAGHGLPSDGDVLSALRVLHTEALETLARRIPVARGWSDLAVCEETARSLALLESRCRHREHLRGAVGDALAGQLTPGVRVLFSGPSGTGKTLAARLLAATLGKELYALDLSTVVNKYLGETEKNLDAVFSRAEELDVVLLLDEGDALMTRRTDVQTSNDRYANLETNFLLQRLESYEGILLVTTNAGDRIDGAFRRRLDVVVEFRVPDATERWAIWRLHLPLEHDVDDALLDELAARCQLTGGQIRNAVVHASLLALDSRTPIGAEHVELAVRREYRKAGAVCPLRPAAGAGRV